ncbi:MAG: NADH-quinone oxidoreductase subunit L, partial [Syntrophobacteraceae bacterium]
SLGGSNLVEHFLDPVIGLGKDKLLQSAGGPGLVHLVSETGHHHSFELEYWLMLLTVVIVFGGILFAYTMYMKKRSLPGTLAAGNPSLYRLLLNKWYVDELYEKTVIKPLRSISDFLWKGIDVVVIDGLVNSTAGFFMKCGVTWKSSQTGNVQRYAVSFLVGVFVLVAYYMYMR